MDFSEADQRRAREIVQLFSQRESRDELGIGVVRDVFSNLLFPGVSVIQTRARYFLLVPWLVKAGTQRGRRGRELLRWLENEERKLIETLRRGGDTAGLIGVEAGTKVKILPSTIYWNALATYGINRWGGTIEQVAGASGKRQAAEDALTELIDRADSAWDPEIPPPPSGFPALESMDFVLSEPEAGWLKERILATTEGSLLHWLVLNDAAPASLTATGTTNWAWTEPTSAGAPVPVLSALRHAELFSLVMHGAALLYNLMLSERAERLGHSVTDRVYADRLEQWQAAVDDADLGSWNLNSFWTLVSSHHAGALGMTHQFVSRWIDLAREGQVVTATGNAQARVLIEQRERSQKGPRARLVNDRLMSQWNGASGADRLGYRWFQVVRMLNDLNPNGSADA